MNRPSLVLALLVGALPLLAIPANAQSWQSRVKDELQILGHRNWILVVDSAYPAQVGAGIETIETNSDQLEVVRSVLAEIRDSIHVRPVISMDAELPFVPEQKGVGVSNYRAQICETFAWI
ncbi:MAG TPA: hypothetical protein VFA85_00465 [Terriglobales bacterium]|nr:hypothetical protein [Terriglobales bacterium]